MVIDHDVCYEAVRSRNRAFDGRMYTGVTSTGISGAVRAAASGNARNPIAIAIPCHRVIGRDGTLRGYAGGIERKRWLIEHERRA